MEELAYFDGMLAAWMWLKGGPFVAMFDLPGEFKEAGVQNYWYRGFDVVTGGRDPESV